MIAVSTLVMAAVLFGPSSVAVAGPPDPSGTTSAAAGLSDGRAVNSVATAQASANYWTPDRMRRAVPADGPVASTGAPAPSTTRGPIGFTLPAQPAGPTARPAAAGGQSVAAAVTESAVAGKVFFRKPSDGRDYVCSGTALNSSSKQLVVTAGHCVHEGRGGGYMQNWVFVPRYRSGSRPFGTFSAKQFRTFSTWISSSDLQRDVAMVTTFPLNNQKLVNVVGGDGLTWNAAKAVGVTILGYPGNFSGGEVQQACQGTTRDGSNNTIAINCNFGGGSSGSGWVVNFNNSTGLGNVNGAMSTVDGSGVNRASYFDDSVKAMFDAQGGVT